MTPVHPEVIWLSKTVFNGETLGQIFELQCKNDKMAWYVDYFTEDAVQYNVKYLAQEGKNKVMMTNENKEQRDVNDPAGSMWTADDVAEWFGKSDPQHIWEFIFSQDSGDVFGIHCEAYRVFPFGPRALSLPVENMWDCYIVDGILGPLSACLHSQSASLVAFIADAKYPTLADMGLAGDYVQTAAAILDA